MTSVNTNWIALAAVAALAGCEAAAAPAPTASHAAIAAPVISHETALLAGKSLAANSLPEIQMLATPAGRLALSNVVACALPAGASITVIAGDGAPYAFSGRHGLAPGWASHAATATDRTRVAGCVQKLRS